MMVMFTWWDARGRRLPWLIALVLIFCGAYAAVASAAVRPAPVASQKARALYQQDTGLAALHWTAKCSRTTAQTWWKCRASAWRGAYRGNYSLRVRGRSVRVEGRGYVRTERADGAREMRSAEAPRAHQAAGVVSLAKVFLKSTRDAKKACKDAEAFWQRAWRCEGWWGGDCQRRSLARPNYVWCGRPRTPDGDPGHFQYFFMSGGLRTQHMDVWRSALYYAGPNGTSALRLVRGTTKWKVKIHGGGPPT